MKQLAFLVVLLLLGQCAGFVFKELFPSASQSEISVLSNYTFTYFRSQNNNFGSTNYQTQPVNTTDTLTVTFPAQYTNIASVTCQSVTVDGVSISNFNCSTSATTVTFIGAFASLSNYFVANVQAVVGNVINPSPAITATGFTGTIGLDTSDPAGNQGVTLTAGFFPFCAITFNPTTVSNPTSTMVISLTPANALSPTATIQVQFPASTWANDISNTLLPISASMACTNQSNNIKSGILCVGSSNTLITMSNIFLASTSTSFAIGVNSFLSPPSDQASDLITITSYQGANEVDTCSTFPSGLTPNSFLSFALTSTATMTVNTWVPLRFTVTLSATINRDDYFRVVFPTGTSFSYSNPILGTAVYTQPPTISGQTVQIHHSSAVSATQRYLVSSTYVLVIQNFQTPPSTIPTQPIVFSVIRNNYPIMTGSASLTAVADTLTASVSLANSQVWTSTQYTFSIPLGQPLSSSGLIKITLPTEVLLTTSAPSCAVLTGIGINSSPSCSFGSNFILISNINGSTSDIASGQTLQLAISGLTNPGDTATSGTFSIQTYYTSDQTGITQVGTAPGITATVGTINMATVSVMPSSYVVLQSGVTYTVTFNNTYLIPQGGFISLQVPSDITIQLGSLSIYTKYSLNNGGTVTASSTGAQPSFYQINFTNIAQSGPIPANTVISLIIDTICTNPTNTRIISPFKLTTFSPSSSQIQTLTGITVQMTTPAAYYVFSAARLSDQNSALTNYEFTLKQEAALPNGTLVFITFPAQISMTASSACTDVALSCLQTSFQDLIVTLPAITAGAQYLINVTNVKNPPSYRPSTGNFTATTKTGDQISIYTEGRIPSPFTNSLPSAFTSISYSFTPGAFGSSQSLTLTLDPSNSIAPTYFLVALAPSLTPTALTCNSFVGFTGSCTLATATTLNVTGITGTSALSFTITGFTSPTTLPSDFTSISSFQNSFMIDQDTNTVNFTIGCVLPCRTCSNGNTSACLSCYNDPAISLNNLLFPTNSQCVSSCPSGYYDSGSLTCLACASTCLTCNLVSTNCTSCNTSSANPALNISNNVGSCLSACPLYFYLSNTATPPQCVVCDNNTYHCSTCSAIDSCTTCLANFFFYQNTCIPNCPSNFTVANHGTWTCDPCSTQCATCMGVISNCTSCASTSAFYNGQCVTSCPFPLIINAGSCVNCDSTCKVCSGLKSNCTACYTNSSQPYLTVTSSFVGSCTGSCPQNFYGDLANGLCQACSSLNIGCSDCSSQTTCNICDVNTAYVFYLNTCVLVVPTGFYNDTGIARACSATCATCDVLANNCTSCIGALALDGNQCTSTCPTGQVVQSNLCVACLSPCKTCFGTTSNCTSCLALATSVYLINGGCQTTCPNYTFPNTSSLICELCTAASNCQTCFSAISCTSCVNGFFLYNDTCGPSSGCPVGTTIAIDRLCAPCTSPCYSCSGSLATCTSCISTYYLYNTSSPTCVQTCPPPLFIDIALQICTGCNGICLTCFNETTNCTSCPSGLFLQINTCLSACDIGFYALGTTCTVCPTNCSACISALSCTGCSSGTYLDITSCVVVCPSQRPIVNVNGSCSTCTDTFCVSCNASNYCSACYFPRLLVQGTCQTACPADYVVDSNGTTCIYSPTTIINGTTTATVAQSLATSSIFPLPFTISAGFVAIACLMSRFQHEKTFIWGALYSLWGLLEWAAVGFLLIYYKTQGNDTAKLSYYLVLGGLGALYFFNFIFIFIQNISLRNDRRLVSWLAGTFNSCWYYSATIIGLFATNKFKNILFCKLFNFTVFSAKLENVHCLRSYNAFGFFAFFSSLAVIAGTSMLLSETAAGYTQLYLAMIDVLILTILEMILALCHTKKEEDYFDDVDEDGLKINKRIQSFDEVLNQHIQPSVGEQMNRTFLEQYETARKFSVNEGMSEVGSIRSMRDISIQADQLLGERSRISRLGTQNFSDFSMFERAHDISVQMDEHKQLCDMSVGQEVNVKDVSISPPSILHQDVSVSPIEHSVRDVSIQQTARDQNQISVQYSHNNKEISVQMDRPEQEEVSIQMDKPEQGEVSIQMDRPEQMEISIQMSRPSQHSISIQEVPMFVDETVHMTKEEDQIAIQCNAEQQEISIQYSAKPLFQNLNQDLNSQSLTYTQHEELEEDPSDLDLQRRMLQGRVVPAQKGLKQELQLDIEEKLQRKKKELESIQRQRWEKEKEDAKAKFQERVIVKEEEFKRRPEHKEEKLDMIFNNDDQKPGEVSSSQFLTQQIIELGRNNAAAKIQESSRIERPQQEVPSSYPRPPRPPTARTERELLQMLSGDKSHSKNEDSLRHEGGMKKKEGKRKVQIQHGNVLIDNQPDFFPDEGNETFEQEELGVNAVERFPQTDKSRSTANMTGRRNEKELILEDSEEEGYYPRREEVNINARPFQPNRDQKYKEQEVDQHKKTNLNQFLQKRRNNSVSAKYTSRRSNPNVVEQDDALNRQLAQRPLQPQKSQQLYTEGNRYKKKPSQSNFKPQEFQFDNNDRIYNANDMYIEEDALEREAKKKLHSKSSEKRLPEREVILEQPRKNSKSKGYLKDTYTSEQKRKSLEKIYLAKLSKK